MHEIVVGLVVFVIAVVAIAGACRRYGLPSPLVLTVVGLAASFLPWTPNETLEPDLVLIVLLPPLLYAAAIQVSLVDFRRETRAILLLSVGLVVATAFAVAAVGWAILPIPLAAAFALGAVVGPPDAVAATAVGRRIGLPRRVVTLLEGESLVNDATAIVLLRTASAAIVGTVTAADLAGGFALSVIGGLAVGLGVAWVVGLSHSRIDDPVVSTAISLVTPWLAFLPAEQIHGSGVLAVVVTGLVLAHHSPRRQSAEARASQRTNWRTLQFLLENSVFLLAGLQASTVLRELSESPVDGWTVVAFCAAVLVVVVVVRPMWVFALRRIIRTPDRRGNTYTAGELGVVSWAGMRGVVTLAAVLTLPQSTPYRQVLVLAAMVVVGVTLLVQGATLPWAAKRFCVTGPDPGADALQGARMRRAAANAGLAELDRVVAAGDEDPEVVDQLRERSLRRSNMAWEELRGRVRRFEETPGEAYRRLRLRMLDVERVELLRMRDEEMADHEVLSQVLFDLDAEETVLKVASARLERASDTLRVAAPPEAHHDCRHLAEAEKHPDPEASGDHCHECEIEGLRPHRLRICLTCGNVGCCDSSEGRHAEAHHRRSGHPVIRSFEEDETWRWCYVDEELG